MFRISLRLRLTLAFLVLVGLLAAVAVTSSAAHGEVSRRLTELRSGGGLDLREVDLEHVALELEGTWREGRGFVASDVELLPARQDPKLRGAVSSVDPRRGTFELFGLTLRVSAETELEGREAGTEPFQYLHPGRRVEVTCDVDADGRWEADRLRVSGVKDQDKIKATMVAVDLDGVPPDIVGLHGLRVELDSRRTVAPESAVWRVRAAANLSRELLRCRALAQERVVGDGQGTTASDLERSVATLQQSIALLRTPTERPRAGGPTLDLLAARAAELEERVQDLDALVEQGSPEEARTYLDAELVPFLAGDLHSLVDAYLSQADDDLGDELRALGQRAEATSRVASWSAAAAVLLSLVLGVWVWRSVQRPIAALHRAARRLGEGRLDTRVESRATGELGELAQAFDQMAAALATNTVGLTNLERVFDSMAAGLVVLDARGAMVSANGAAGELLGYARSELIGLPFGAICAEAADVGEGPLLGGRCSGPGGAETGLTRKDGSEVQVSLSCAELRPADGSLQGFVCVAQDLTDRKYIEEQVRRALAEKELLLREVHHRVKNNMQVISSLLAMQSSRADDPRVAASFEESQGRIRSMALIHEQLYRSADLTGIDLDSYLRILTDQLLESFGGETRIDVDVRVTDPGLEVDRALACGLIVNELVANAVKHAFPRGGGRVRLSLVEGPNEMCELVVADDGLGLTRPGDLVGATSMGMSLIRTLVDQLEGELAVESTEGLSVRVTFPRHSRVHERREATA